MSAAELKERQRIAQSILRGLNPDHQQQLKDVIDYMGSLAESGGRIPEGSLAGVLLKQPPAVQHAVRKISALIEDPRDLPFQPKRSEAQRAEQLGLDPTLATAVKGELDAIEVAGTLMDRMKTDADMPKAPPTMKDHIAAALDAHQPRVQRQQAVEREVAKAGTDTGLPLRSHLETALEIGGYPEERHELKGADGDIRDSIERSIALVGANQ